MSWPGHCLDAFRPHPLDLTIERLDHAPVALAICAPAAGGPGWHQRKQAACNVNTLARPEVQQQ
eukprot:14348284-Alexandrium_andersonii.AAC.1